MNPPRLCQPDCSLIAADAQAVTRLHDWLLESEPGLTRYLFLTGPYGAGKTYFIKQFVDAIQSGDLDGSIKIDHPFEHETRITCHDDLHNYLVDRFHNAETFLAHGSAQTVWVFVDGVPRRCLEKQSVSLPAIPNKCRCVITVDLPDDYHCAEAWSYQQLEVSHGAEKIEEQFYAIPLTPTIPRRLCSFVDWRKRNRQLLEQWCEMILRHRGNIDPESVNLGEFRTNWDEITQRVEESPHASFLTIAIVCEQVLKTVRSQRLDITEINQTLLQLKDASATQIANEFVDHNVTRMLHPPNVHSASTIWTVLGAIAVAHTPLSTTALGDIFALGRSAMSLTQANVSQIAEDCDLLILNSTQQWIWMWPLLRSTVINRITQNGQSHLLDRIRKDFAFGSMALFSAHRMRPQSGSLTEAEVYAVCSIARHMHEADRADLPNDRLTQLLSDPYWLIQRLIYSTPEEAALDLALGRTDLDDQIPLLSHLGGRLLTGRLAFAHNALHNNASCAVPRFRASD